MGKAPANLGDFDSSDTFDLSSLSSNSTDELVEESIEEVVEAEKEPSTPTRSVAEVAKATVRKQKALRTEKPKYVSGTISAELDRRLKLLNIDTGISRQQALNEALDAYCRSKGYIPEVQT